VAITELKDRADRLFGRERDLAALRARAGVTGLTVIAGPPQIGKSWLLMALAHRLAAETAPPVSVGFTRSPRGAHDPLLQVVSDLYQRWLAEAGAWQQARTVWAQQKGRLLPAVGRFVGKLSEKAAKLVPGGGELPGTAIKESLDALVAASEDLRTGRLIVSRLEYSDARDLVGSMQAITGRPVALLLDQWEETGGLDAQVSILRDFLREPDEWPCCHIFLGARDGTDAASRLDELKREYPGVATLYRLGELDLSAASEQRRMVTYLRERVAGIWNVGDDRVVELVDGYPRVISRWVADDARETAQTLEGLQLLVRESIEFRYSDLEKLLLGLDGDGRKLAVRLALVPLAEDAGAWPALRPIMMADVEADALDDLRIASVLQEDSEAPRFGHAKRRDAARSFLETHRRETVRAEAGRLALALARCITVIDETKVSYATALRGLSSVRTYLGPVSQALCQAATRLLGEKWDAPDALLAGARQARTAREPGIAFVLASCLFNTLIDAKAEDDLPRRDALLDELRALSAANPADAAVREQLAKGLFNTLIDAKAEDDLPRRDALLDELRALAAAHPDDGWVDEVRRVPGTDWDRNGQT
jgi:hypothetical protein